MHNSLSLLTSYSRFFALWPCAISILVSSCVAPSRPVQPTPAPTAMAAPPPPVLAAPPYPAPAPMAEESIPSYGGMASSPSTIPSAQPSGAVAPSSAEQPHTILAGPEYGQVDHVVKTVGGGPLPHVSVVGIKQSDSEDGRNVLIEGTLRNQGAVPTKWVKVKIEAQDETGRAITTMSPQPTAQVIPPGGSATFAAQLANDPAVRKFFIKADFR